MKILATIALSCFTSIYSFSQLPTKIGRTEEQIFPLVLDQPNSFADLIPLTQFFEAKQIIGMGEATHGTKEFFETKARLFKFLATNCGYRIFGIEAAYGGCSYINDYVLSGKGNLDSVVLNFDFWTWRTEEIKELIVWIRNYNLSKTATEKISFYGFDLQNFYSPIQYLNQFFKLDNKIAVKAFKAIIRPIISKTEQQLYQQLQEKDRSYQDTLLATARSLKYWFAENSTLLEANYSPLQLKKLDFCIRNFEQAVINTNPKNKPNYRDSCMAENILAIQKFENNKMFIWAHNGHINLTYPDKISALIGLPMGGYIKRKMADHYYAIGFVFNQGSFQAVKGPNSMTSAFFKFAFNRKNLYKGLQTCTVPVNSNNTFTNFLSTAKRDFFIDLNSSRNEVFSTTLKTYDIGAVFLNYKNSSDDINAKKQFNGLIYIDHTTATTPIKPNSSNK